jgi:hypothetical protein
MTDRITPLPFETSRMFDKYYKVDRIFHQAGTEGYSDTRFNTPIDVIELPAHEAKISELLSTLEKLADAIAAIDTTQNRMELIDELGEAEEEAEALIKKLKERR